MNKINLANDNEESTKQHNEVHLMSFQDIHQIKKKDLEKILESGDTVFIISRSCKPIKLVLASFS